MITPQQIIRELNDRSLLAYEEVFPYDTSVFEYDANTVFSGADTYISEDNGTLIFSGGSSTYGDAAVWGKSETVNTQGLAFGFAIVTRTSGTVKIGLDTNQAGDVGSLALVNSSDNLTLADGGAVIGEMTAGTPYHYAFVMNSSGGVYICVRGGSYLDWSLLLPLAALPNTPATVYPTVNNYDGVLTVGSMKTAQFLNTWDTADDLVRSTPATAQGTTFTHAYNCVVSWVQSSLDDATTDMEVRKRTGSDASVRFRVESDGTARIIEHDGSSPTTLVSSSAGAVSLNDRVTAIVFGKNAYFVFGDDGSGGGISATMTGYSEFETTGSVLSYSAGTVSFSSIKVYDITITDRLAAQLKALEYETLTSEELLVLYTTNGATIAFEDEFTTADAADLTTPYNAEPGPGSRTVTQPDSPFSKSGGALNIDLAVAATNLVDNNIMTDDDITNQAGVVLKATITPDNSTGNNIWALMLADSALGATDKRQGLLIPNTNSIGLSTSDDVNGATTSDYIPLYTYADGVEIDVAMVFIAVDLVGLYVKTGSTWNLYGVYPTQDADTTNRYVIAAKEADSTQLINRDAIAQLSGAWATDYGVATDRLAGDLTTTDTFTHTPDGNISFQLGSIPTTGVLRVDFREQTPTSNMWRLQINSAGACVLFEYASGVPTARASGSVSGGEFMQIIMVDETIKVFADGAAVFAPYTGAAAYKTETTGTYFQTNGGDDPISNLTTLTYTLSGTLSGQLEAV